MPMKFILNPQTIGAIRRFVDDHTTRGGLKQVLMEAGVNPERLAELKMHIQMGAPGYMTKNAMLSHSFDTIPADFSKEESDQIYLNMVKILVRQRGEHYQEDSFEELEAGLTQSDLSLAQVMGEQGALDFLEAAMKVNEQSGLRESFDLIRKSISRLASDPEGTLTAVVSSTESICREAIVRIGLEVPSKQQLPEYLVLLRKSSNLEELCGDGREIYSTISTLANNIYKQAHKTADRHAQGDDAPDPTPFLVDLMICSCASLGIVIANALSRGDLKAKE